MASKDRRLLAWLTLSATSYAIAASPIGIYERTRDGLYRTDFGNWLIKLQVDNEKWDAMTKCEVVKTSKDIYHLTGVLHWDTVGTVILNDVSNTSRLGYTC